MRKKRTIITLSLILYASAALCGFFFFREYVAAQEEISEYTDIQDSYTTTTVPAEGIQSGRVAVERTVDANLPETADLPYVVADFNSLLAINTETAGWVAIPDSLISYPVVQAGSNGKYLNTSFTGERSRTGAVFADCANDMKTLNQNTVLYAHNMGNGRTDMFGTLLYYNDKAHYDSHQYIQFDTVYEQHGWWKIFAVINHDTANPDFDYLKLEFADQEEFMGWTNKAKELSCYDTGVEIQKNDRILTLSTCDGAYYGKRGRQVILAVKMERSQPCY